MSGEMGDQQVPPGITWRDIYRAVSESEVRIVAAINAAVSPLNSITVDHESRIRQLELFGPNRLVEMEKDREANIIKMTAARTDLELRLRALETREEALEGRERGILATLSAGQKTVLLVAAIAGIVVAIIEVASHLVP